MGSKLSAIEIIVIVAVCGFFVWLIGKIDMPSVWRSIFYGVAILLLALWLLDVLGIMRTGVRLR
jgi:hypothetical protein